MSKLRVHLVQENPVVGDLQGNLQIIRRHLDQAVDADLLVFPECFLSGYPLQDLVVRPGFLASVDQALDDLARLVKERAGPAVIVGAPLTGATLPYNAAHLIRPDGTRQVAIKNELPNSDVFDERRTFARGSSPAPLALGEWKLGVMICEDMWHGTVARTLADEGADFLIAINGSPMEIGKQAVRIAHARRRVQATGLPLVYLNLCGGQDEMVFDGSSFALAKNGALQLQAGMEPEVMTLVVERVRQEGVETVDFAAAHRQNGPAIVPYPEELEAIYRTVVVGLRDYVKKNGFSEVLLGLSGGLDSAVVAAIAVDALGPDKLLAVMMPAEYTGQESKDLAGDMATRLKCRYATVPVGSIVESLSWSLDQALGATRDEVNVGARQLAGENLQARARGTLLMGLSNARPGALVLSTGNKSEMSVGYATLYGDMCGGFNPIKDLYKTKVQALAAWRNANQLDGLLGPAAPIPAGIISRPPTAELAAGQTDENTLGEYPVLDAVLTGLIELQLGPAAAAAAATALLGKKVGEEYARKISRMVQRAEYKRRQAPPGIKLTAKSFGFGWRYPITNAGALD